MMSQVRISYGLVLVFVWAFLIQTHAQFVDSFDDGDFTQSPPWRGTEALFKVNTSRQLQLNGSGEGTAFLYTSSSQVIPAEWRFWVKLSFSPSANNFCRIYLASDAADLSGPLNGYYLQLGEAGSNDALELFRQNGSQSISICRGVEGFIASSFAIRVRVLHKIDNSWEIWADPLGGSSFQLQATGFDTQMFNYQYFGVFSKFTSSNATKMYFDDFYVGDIWVDSTPPDLLSLEILSDTSISLQFTEALNPFPAQWPSNYTLQPGNLHPKSVLLSSQAPGLIILFFQNPFEPLTEYTLVVDSVVDLAGNRGGPFLRSFSIYQAQVFDVVINELMIDPDPPIDLPNWEYIELYNTTQNTIRLKGWKLMTGKTIKPIPESEIAANAYLLLCRPEAIPELSPYGKCLGISSLSLTNTGQDVRLLNDKNHVISRINYTDKWYRNPEKSQGGWSLEQIDPMAVCLGAFNWKASENISGGTPGGPNSVMATLSLKPLPEALVVLNNYTLKLVFNQQMDSVSLVNPQLYKVSPAVGYPDSTWLAGDDFTMVMLHFSKPFESGQTYRLVIQPALYNCRGEAVPENTFRDFTLPSPAALYDIILTEIMADPDPPVGLPNFEYVELYNRTSSTIDLTGWSLQIGTSTKIFQNVYLDPFSYLIVSSEAAAADLSLYGAFYGFSSFQLTNSGQSLALLNPLGEVIAWVDYTDTWYGDSPKKNGGWSLELVDYQNFCQQEGNWKPSIDASGGTPGRENSVKADNPDTLSPELLRAYPEDFTHLKIFFSEAMNAKDVSQISSWRLPDGPGQILNIFPADYRNQAFIIELSTSMEPGLIYLLRTSGQMRDCSGNSLSQTDLFFGWPASALQGDVIINEILTNPRTGGSDYLEIYNISDKILDLSFMSLTYRSLSATSKPKTIFLPSWLLIPGQYYCITSGPSAVAAQYQVPFPAHLIKAEGFPDLATDPGGVIILSRRENEFAEIDRLEYRPDMHLPVLKNLDGVALERIHPLRPTSDPTNWTSAAESVGYGTPTGKNSQYAEIPPANGYLTASPSIFSPDGDGIDDLTTLTLTAPGEGWLAHVSVYDAMGRLVRQLARALSLGIQTSISWDGTRDDRSLAPLGRYLVVCEFYNTSGQRELVRTTVVLGVRF